MSMLAGPRVKQKVINLRAKNNAWSNDKNKFGQKMLEKMGWSEGKGLGANENGIVEHVVARYKNDDKGLGYVDRNDQWTKHEDDFNALLANLSNATSNEDIIHSGKSLEKKSKTSKARIHYHKFTRGKDLSRYSEKDLANIFGKKSLKNDTSKDIKDVSNEEENQTVVFTEKGSMDEYFKNKLAAIKMKRKLPSVDDDSKDHETDYAFQGFSNTSLGDEDYQNGNTFEYSDFTKSKNVNTENVSNIEESEVRIKRKKSKGSDKSKSLCENGNSIELPNFEDIEEKEEPKHNTTMVHETCYETNSDSLVKKKKKKKSKNKEKLPQNDTENVELVEPEECTKLEKCSSSIAESDEQNKKKRKKDINIDNCMPNQTHEHLVKSKKKKKKKL